MRIADLDSEGQVEILKCTICGEPFKGIYSLNKHTAQHMRAIN